MTQQGLRQASARNQSGFATETNYNEDLMRLFDADGIPAGTFNERQLRWINSQLSASYTNLTEAMQAYATSQDAYNWSSMGTLGDMADFTRAMPAGSTYTRTGVATALNSAGVLESFLANAPQRTDRGLTLEPERTNFLFRSAEFDNAYWTKTASTISANAVTAPDGTATGDTMFPTATTAAHFMEAVTALSVTNGTTYAYSSFLQNAGQRYMGLALGTGPFGSGNYALFDTQSGVVTSASGLAGTILAAGSGWYRCAATAASTQTVSTGAFFVLSNGTASRAPSFLGVITNGVSPWGAQFEVGSFATSYIPTTTAAVTRGLPVFTETVPSGKTKALLMYADDTTTLVTGLTPGGTFDYVTPILAANKGRFGASELVSRAWQP